ncbi:MAG: uroporphyrinogen decarboxylase family protein [Planctomycetota bacterium]|jgi:uroporphyrinogen decarboxylase
MDSRERVLLALEHKEPDRVPIDYWATSEVNAKLLKQFDFSSQEQLLQHFDVDFRYIEGPKYIGPGQTIRQDGSQEDHFGVIRRSVLYGEGAGAGTYSEVVLYPLQEATSVDEIENYAKWPSPEHFDYECVRQQAAEARETGKVVVFMGDRLNRCAQLKPAMYVRGVEQILMDVMTNTEIAKTIFHKIAEFYSEYARRTLEAAGGNIDIFFTGDDFGTQDNTFFPVDTWRHLLKEGFDRFVNIGHEFGCKVAHHTCGSVTQLLPDFVESGLDILNPLQPDCARMDYQKIKEQYGDRISFHGGISIQKTMPYGDSQDVRNEVKDRVRKLAGNGGYIFCTAHNIQADTPIENIVTLFEAYRQFGGDQMRA